ncbi:terminase small subunit [Paenibacillus polysaccharolyticus]|uniref:terminase small subunit n=1 Tax=Paenibacillus polysaccharolyticus TaxID=582692 RepID=UPI00203E6A87|nr:terminase small subunit [Paenibacillus polysaccharolyticus]MCM3131887.1 terminase small subunit [Paenibacillus polysaccharolyticus]
MKEQHKAFADYYIETMNGTESYKRAYPNCKKDATARVNASKLLANPNIQEYIKEILESKDAERIANQDEVLIYLTQVMRGEVKDQLGLETPVKERNKAAELLGKRYALWVDKQEINASVTPVFVDDISGDGNG